MAEIREELRTRITLDDKQHAEATKRVENRTSRLTKWIAGVGAVLVAGATAWHLYRRATQKADQSLLSAGRAFALTRTEIGFLNSLAKKSGTQFGQLAGTFDTFSDLLGSGIQQNKDFKQAIKEIGIEAWAGTSPISKFMQIIEALSKVQDRFQRRQLERRIFAGGAGGIRGLTSLGPRETAALMIKTAQDYRRFMPREISAQLRQPSALRVGAGMGITALGAGGLGGGLRQRAVAPGMRGLIPPEYEHQFDVLKGALDQIVINTQGVKEALQETAGYGFLRAVKAGMTGG